MEQGQNTEPKKILLVDDEDDIRKIVAFQLKRSGYNVITAVDGEEALKKARTESPDLIILDLMLPKMDGHKVCGLLKRDIRYASIPIIIFTARIQENDKKLCEEAGADSYIPKPFQDAVFMEEIRKLLKNRKG